MLAKIAEQDSVSIVPIMKPIVVSLKVSNIGFEGRGPSKSFHIFQAEENY